MSYLDELTNAFTLAYDTSMQSNNDPELATRAGIEAVRHRMVWDAGKKVAEKYTVLVDPAFAHEPDDLHTNWWMGVVFPWPVDVHQASNLFEYVCDREGWRPGGTGPMKSNYPMALNFAARDAEGPQIDPEPFKQFVPKGDDSAA